MTYPEKLSIAIVVGVFTLLYIAMTQGSPYRSTLGDRINEGICHRMHGIYSTQTGHCTKGRTHEKK